MDHDDLIEAIWPSVQEANIEGPAHAQIFKSKVLVTSPDKPFQRVGKGTVIRSAIIKDYSPELEVLYASTAHKGGPSLESSHSLEAVIQFVRACAASFLSKREMTDQDDLFVAGLDSLQTLELTNGLKAGLNSHLGGPDLASLTSKLVYSHPTVKKLAQYVYRLLNPDFTDKAGEAVKEQDRVECMESMVEKYTRNLPTKAAAVNGVNGISEMVPGTGISGAGLCVVLTGSTGTLGTNLLQTLLSDRNISKIYCLNRARDARERHQESFVAQGKHYDLDMKVKFLTAEFGHEHFGQPNEVGLIHVLW